MFASDDNNDKINDKCGIVGIFNNKNAGYFATLSLHALQHRGHEASGVYSYELDTCSLHEVKHHGTIIDSFSQDDVSSLKGLNAIGHARYSTSGDKITTPQPYFVSLKDNQFVTVAHNGNLIKYDHIVEDLEKSGYPMTTSVDTEIIGLLIKQKMDTSPELSIQEAIIGILPKITGAFSLVIMSPTFICAVRDPRGIRPLALGALPDLTSSEEISGKSYIIASETCAMEINKGKPERDIEPGEVLFISDSGVESFFPFKQKADDSKGDKVESAEKSPKSNFCIFEYIYFARPDSVINGRSVYDVRKEIGRNLAIESPVEADCVIPVPDSGIVASIGYSQQANIPIEFGIIRSHYVGRTFIDPTKEGRSSKVRMKHSVNPSVVKGKRVILIDDSIVRGTTSRKIVDMLYTAGVKEIHMKISSPPTKHSCIYGIDTPNSEDLLAHDKSVKDIQDFLKIDSLSYLSIDMLYKSVRAFYSKDEEFCSACFTGNYPI